MERSADEKAFDIMKLERSLALRPSREKLVESNVIKMKGSESAARLFATQALSGKLGSRPTMDHLVDTGIIEEREMVIEEEEEEEGA